MRYRFPEDANGRVILHFPVSFHFMLMVTRLAFCCRQEGEEKASQ
jgi:hypothetical protein